jgi:hypothetical protein
MENLFIAPPTAGTVLRKRTPLLAFIYPRAFACLKKEQKHRRERNEDNLKILHSKFEEFYIKGYKMESSNTTSYNELPPGGKMFIRTEYIFIK